MRVTTNGKNKFSDDEISKKEQKYMTIVHVSLQTMRQLGGIVGVLLSVDSTVQMESWNHGSAVDAF